MTPARKAAIAKWQKAGANARKAKARSTIPRSEYSGKMLTLYHRTTPLSASRIVVNGFRNRMGRGTERYKYGEAKVFGGNFIRGQIDGYGKGIVSFKVNRKHAVLDDEFPSGERHYAIDPRNIKKSSINLIAGQQVRKRRK